MGLYVWTLAVFPADFEEVGNSPAEPEVEQDVCGSSYCFFRKIRVKMT